MVASNRSHPADLTFLPTSYLRPLSGSNRLPNERDRLMKLRRLMIEVPAYGPNHEEVHHKQVCTNNADLAACLCMFKWAGHGD